MTIPRLAVLADYPEEGWSSMDLCGDMLVDHLPRVGPFAVEANRLCPRFRRVATRLPRFGRSRTAHNADRLANRFLFFPHHIRGAARHHDLFHIVDHTYAQLALELPRERTGVFCHDLDAFRCLIDPALDSRPWWFRALAGRIRAGLRAAAVVFHTTAAIGEQLRAAELVAPERLVLAPCGVAPEFQPNPARAAVRLPELDSLDGNPWLLHVGSCIPRKRIDVLLDVFAEVRSRRPGTQLLKVGGEWSPAQRAQIARLGLDRDKAIIYAQNLTRLELAEAYRRAGVVLVPSDSEGFGLPVIEALACGTPVVASDLPTLREVGGPVTTFAPVGAVEVWADAVAQLLDEPEAAAVATRAARLAWAARFTWSAQAATIAQTYHDLLHGRR